jgi:hypothetical protein
MMAKPQPFLSAIVSPPWARAILLRGEAVAREEPLRRLEQPDAVRVPIPPLPDKMHVGRIPLIKAGAQDPVPARVKAEQTGRDRGM